MWPDPHALIRRNKVLRYCADFSLSSRSVNIGYGGILFSLTGARLNKNVSD
jgi:hypothetical protein